jgi:Uma2 family endonuclease
VLAVEVAESSLDYDRTDKGGLYARAGVPDYWIANLIEGDLEVYRQPEPDASSALGWRYGLVARLIPPAVVAPLAFPAPRIAVADLLP